MIDLEYSGTLEVVDRLRKLSFQGEEIVNFAGGTLNDTPKAAKETTKRAIDDGLGGELTDSGGLLELREMIAERLAAEDKVKVDPLKEVIVTVGAKNAILQAIYAIIEPGEEVLILDPYWPSYKPLVSLTGAVPKPVPMKTDGHFRVDEKAIRREVGARSRMIIVNTPHNPTGRVFSKEELEVICDIANEHNLFVLSDECYKELVYDGNKHYSIASFPDMRKRTIITYSFSKAYTMYGWRVGYAAGPEEIIRRMLIIQSNTVSCPTSFAQSGAVGALKDKEGHLPQIVKAYQHLRDLTVKELNRIEGVSCDIPEGAFWVFPDVSGLASSSEPVVDYLMENERIAMTAGSAFGSACSKYLRIIYRHEESYLKRGLEKLEKAIRRYKQKGRAVP
jgi:aspartate/methionine/tyrosine aminotransferase